MEINIFSSSELEQLLHEIGEINTAFFPAHFIVALLAIGFLILCYSNSKRVLGSRLMKLLLAIIYAINVFGVTICVIKLGGVYYAFNAAIHGTITMMLLFSIFRNDITFCLPKQKGLKILSIAQVTYGMFLYPIPQILLGYKWPEMFIFGAMCPTTIFSIGILITASLNAGGSRLFKWLLGTLSIAAVIVGFRGVLIGGIFDLSLFISGIIGFYVLYTIKEVTTPIAMPQS